jgi:hypothetical protein
MFCLRLFDNAVVGSSIRMLSVSEHFVLGQFEKNVHPAIFHKFMRQLAIGDRQLVGREIEIMESAVMGEDDDGAKKDGNLGFEAETV